MSEVWKPIPGWEGYEVSDLGRVRSYRRSGRGKGFASEPRLLKLMLDRDGYLRVMLSVNANRKRRGVHQLVAEAFLGDSRFEGAIVLHGPDPDRSNNQVANLRWGTHAENTADRVIDGTIGLTRSVQEIAEIKRLYAMGFHQREIARVFKTTQSYVHELVTGKKRKDVA